MNNAFTFSRFICWLVFLSFASINCNNSKSSISLAGKWVVTHENLAKCTNSADDYDTACTTNCTVIVFATNTFTTSYLVNGTLTTYSGVYQINGNKITTQLSGFSAESGTFSLSGNTMVITLNPYANGCVLTTTLMKQN